MDLSSGYVQRSLDQMPKQGDHLPWRLHQNYVRDVALLRRGPVDDDMVFTEAPASQPQPGQQWRSRVTAGPRC
jgi:hypothetical protein